MLFFTNGVDNLSTNLPPVLPGAVHIEPHLGFWISLVLLFKQALSTKLVFVNIFLVPFKMFGL